MRILFGSKDENFMVAAPLNDKALKIKEWVKNFGVLIDSDISFNSHVKAITKSAFYHIKAYPKSGTL